MGCHGAAVPRSRRDSCTGDCNFCTGDSFDVSYFTVGSKGGCRNLYPYLPIKRIMDHGCVFGSSIDKSVCVHCTHLAKGSHKVVGGIK